MTSEAPEHGWLIHKAGRGWYRPDAKGYTMNQDEAGRYSHKDALAYSHPNGIDGPRDGLTYLLEKAKDHQMTPEEIEEQRQSWVRGMTQGCEHGVLDFEQCPDCRKENSDE